MIEIVNRQRLVAVNRDCIKELAANVLCIAAPLSGIPSDASLTIALVRDSTIRKLNCDFRNKDQETDVLSFPGGQIEFPDDENTDDAYLGDIVISTDTAARQARQAAITIERQIQELVMHGILHLCGYDHESDNGQMNRLELRLRKKLLDRPRTKSRSAVSA
ncbi:MAG TPA: rRNA maturation RNase YbeY [Blastocatellia bacterium]|nr:rRNA maturation RNase YbeY [Blastocatellia bacterium]